MSHGVNPYGYAFWQSFGPLVLLLIIQVLRRDLWLEKRGVIYAFLCGFFGIVLPNLLIYMTIVHIPSGLLTVLANISPIFTYVLAVSFKDERFTTQRFFAVALGVLGIGCIILPSQNLLDLNISNAWLLVCLLIPLSYAFSAVYISRFHPGVGSSLSYSLWMLMFSTLFISPLAVINNGYYSLKMYDMSSFLILVEILLSTLGYVLLFIIIRMVGSVYYTLVNAVAVSVGVFYGVMVFGQKFSIYTYMGVAIILLAMFLLTFLQRRKQVL